jgi:GcrA cell cycle regulator
VLGKVHRLNLPGRATIARKTYEPRPKRRAVPRPKSRVERITDAARKATAPSPYAAPVEDLVIPEAERKTINTLTDTCCRWPIGDPRHPDFHFCGKTKVAGISYCEHHARRAFQPPQVKPRDYDRHKPIEPALEAPRKVRVFA